METNVHSWTLVSLSLRTFHESSMNRTNELQFKLYLLTKIERRWTHGSIHIASPSPKINRAFDDNLNTITYRMMTSTLKHWLSGG